MEPDGWMRKQDLADAIGVDVRTVTRMVARGEVRRRGNNPPLFKYVGRVDVQDGTGPMSLPVPRAEFQQFFAQWISAYDQVVSNQEEMLARQERLEDLIRPCQELLARSGAAPPPPQQPAGFQWPKENAPAPNLLGWLRRRRGSEAP